MFLGELFEFQKIHEQNLLMKCKNNKELLLDAPTGCGKTVLACKFIDDYLDENPKTVFLWLCPGAGAFILNQRIVLKILFLALIMEMFLIFLKKLIRLILFIL